MPAPAPLKSADAPPDSWIYKCPARVIPYLQLIRADRPIGSWLLLLPCWWGLALGGGDRPMGELLYSGGLFALGAVVMRGAGCVYNDIIDSDIDAQVTRTATRPIPAGLVTKRAAALYLIALCLAGLLVLCQFNTLTIIMGCAALLPVAAYPFMKRLTWWPQAWLGLTFNWGALLGWTGSTGGLAPAAIALYVAGIFWTLSYDTIYAHQDKEDDALIGVKSSARYLGAKTARWLWIFGALQFACLYLASCLAGGHIVTSLLVLIPALHQVWQIRSLDIEDPGRCLRLFRSNRDLGLLVLIALLITRF